VSRVEATAAAGFELRQLANEVVACRRCPRLVDWREAAARNPPLRFAGQHYWSRPLPGFGDPDARILIVGLAPAAHGGNRTGRIFTGDRSGDFLFGALYRAGLASQPESVSRDDGLTLRDTYITAVNRCCPPANKPTPEERDTCLPYLVREVGLLGDAHVVVALGAFAWDGALRAVALLGEAQPRPRFGHGVEAGVGRWTFLGCFHPSQQNTFTRRLTPAMLDAVLDRAKVLAGVPVASPDRG
jgi:uracil-DNA glycosylase family 4